MYETVQNTGEFRRESKSSRNAEESEALTVSCVDAKEQIIVSGTTEL